MPSAILLTFDGEVVPTQLLPGERCFRVVGDGQYPNGSFWTRERPTDVHEMRRDYALLNAWNGDHGLVVLEVGAAIAVWEGITGPQPSSDRAGHLPGGARQLWLSRGSLNAGHGRWTIEPL